MSSLYRLTQNQCIDLYYLVGAYYDIKWDQPPFYLAQGFFVLDFLHKEESCKYLMFTQMPNNTSDDFRSIIKKEFEEFVKSWEKYKENK